MKRLKHYLLNEESNTITYKKMYNGKTEFFTPAGESYFDYISLYYHEDIGF